MNWTYVKPTEAGSYIHWYAGNGRLCLVRQTGGRYECWDEYDRQWLDLSAFDHRCQWFGPIPEPQKSIDA